MNTRLLIALSVLTLSGCATTEKPHSVSSEQLDRALANQSEALVIAMSENNQELHQQQQQLLQHIEELESQLVQLEKKATKPTPVPTASPKEECAPTIVTENNDKMVFGEAERVGVPDYQRHFNARVDTGATSTSMTALNIEQFERDGSDWVRFELPAQDDKPTKYEAKVHHFVQIKKASEDANIRRPVILVRLQIGNYSGETEVNLSDRSHMEFPLLLGRNFFKDIAVVDVSEQYVQSK